MASRLIVFLLMMLLSGCSGIQRLDDIRADLRQSKDRIDALVKNERKDQLNDAFDELCKEAQIGQLMSRLGGDLNTLKVLCGWELKYDAPNPSNEGDPRNQ